MKKALITGITGQDGAYLAHLLIRKGYAVHGIKRRVSLFHTDRIDDIYENSDLQLHYGDLTDTTSLCKIVSQVKPDEVYNLAAQSHVAVSFSEPEYTAQADGLGTLRLLEAIRIAGIDKSVKFYQACTSELYGKVVESPQSIITPFNPASPYAAAKLYSYYMTKIYRESYNMFAVNGILFNHESPLRGETFVTRKITRYVAQYSKDNTIAPLQLGNIDALRDWGHAKDYVKAMWLMLQQEEPKDYVIGTGVQYSVRQFVAAAFAEIGEKIIFKGKGLEEVGYNQDGKEIVRINPKYFRPNDVNALLADPKKAQKELEWSAEIEFNELVSEMVKCDIIALEQNLKFYTPEFK